MLNPLVWFSCMSLGLLAACGSCGTSKVSDAVRRCRQDQPAYMLPPMLEGRDGIRSADNSVVKMHVQLPLRDTPALDALLVQLYDPNSTQYLKFLTPEEFRARFHPTPSHHANVKAHLEKHGIKRVSDEHGAIATYSGTLSQAQTAFDTEIHKFSRPDGRVVQAPVRPLGGAFIPEVRAVHGLSTPMTKRTHLLTRSEPHTALSSGGFNAATIKKAYGLSPQVGARTETIGFVQLDGYLDSDIDAYAKANNIPRTPTKNILIGGYDGKVVDKNSQVEVTMDLQLAMGLVGGKAKELRVYSARNTAHAFTQILNEIANPSIGDKQLVKYISCSWGTPEDEMSSADVLAEHDLFRQMAAQGQVFAVASGDSGGKDDGEHIGVDDPGNSPFTLSVGGTSLSLLPNGQRANEAAWSGSGGGVSCYWPAPFWQKTRFGIPHLDNARNVPDVSLHADPGGLSGSHIVIVNGQTFEVGGTSAAAPIWTAFSAAVGSLRVATSKPPLGNLAPHLYRLGDSSLSSHVFFDVDAGSNGVYSAGRGYDLSSGWGPFVGDALLGTLAAL